ncbi:MBL fold metallo-hydrolase RNA specificity domain-containing protein [Desulforhopalus singaporensis]|uniref:Metallo-beta-lactamase family protein n=1 Tax=Desulforhopalus singaporensis TaxID=91360 RepID=A0A1H0TU00_9BACT|nr:MBL fold metallo-hydrolase [Desulforhopalus singaporensis]SDP57128.1 metallo-beta-lactamase family protein [Desulforhopalus singaporensis]
MHVTFYGATREVTGSFHTLSTDSDTILLDCGLFQGRRKEAEAKNRVLPINPKILTNMVLSHAHIDHSGRIPMMTKNGFNGQVFCSRATAHACEYLLRDSAKIQEGDASYLNYKTAKYFLSRMKTGGGDKKLTKTEINEIRTLLKSGNHDLRNEVINNLLREQNLEVITPLYSLTEAEEALEYFQGVPFAEPVTIGSNLTCTFYVAGHILGSAMSVLQYANNGQVKNILYSGDLGRFNKPIIKDPTLDFKAEHREIDLMIMESTYGDRLHEPVFDMKPLLKQVLIETFDRGGSVIIPAFAYGRTQELIYFLHELYLAGEVPPMPVWVDSPLATKITHVFGEHPETYDEETHQAFLSKGLNPFDFHQLKFVQTVEESIALNRDQKSHVVLAGSGMCEGGRILHHLRHKIHDERNTILIVGYMGENTFGRQLQMKAEKYEEGGRKGEPPTVRFYNKEYPLKAHVKTLGGFSAHGDRNEMTRILRESNLSIKKIALVHGEKEQINGFAEHLRGEGYEVTIPYQGQSIRV